ncbi:beta strand repeat-containing protein [Microbacterium enclense]|uniref:beta strand repeat-containing protein n=1 Tax=Microbacterium enclense TaxID=993073 RepID=UPI003D733538
MRTRQHDNGRVRADRRYGIVRTTIAMAMVAVLGLSAAPAATAVAPTTNAVAAAFTTAPTPTFTGPISVGSALTAVTGTWTPTPDTFTYQWNRNGVAIIAATGKTWTLTAADVGKKITVTVTASKSGYTRTARTSTGRTAVAGVFSSAPNPSFSGSISVGSTLTAAAGTWTPAPDAFAYQWNQNGIAIAEANARTFTLTPAQVGKKVTVTVTASRSGYTSAARTSTGRTAVTGAFTTVPTPTVSGKTFVGSTLSAAVGTWVPSPETLTYQWNRDGQAIPGATTRTYLLAPADNGRKITVRVTATKTGYTPTTSISAARIPAPGPFATAPTPTISGSIIVGSTVTAVPGTWTPTPTALAYQWMRNGAAISGATASTYRLSTADAGNLLSVSVTASAPGYAATTRVSLAQSVPTQRFTTTARPTINGDPTVGSVLTASTGTWAPTPDYFTYQWRRDALAIPGATASTYTLGPADVGEEITVTVAAIKTGYTRTPFDSAWVTVTAGSFAAAPTPSVTGTAQVGGTLVGVTGTWSPQPATLSYQWTRNGTPIDGATNASYLLVEADRGAQVRLAVTATKAGYTTLTRTSAAKTILGVFTTTPTPSITGTLQPGATVTASTGTWSPTPDSFTYQWQRDGSAIAGATAKTYTLSTSDAGVDLTVTVTALKAGYVSATKTSEKASVPAAPTVSVTGDITADTTWAPTVPTVYVVTKPITVTSGATLTVGGRAIVKFANGAQLTVAGSLVARGTAAQPIPFTSLNDDTAGGDTDGPSTAPGRDWPGIRATNGGTIALDRVRVSYVTWVLSASEAASVSVTSSVVDGSVSTNGTRGTVRITDNTFRQGSLQVSRPDGAAYTSSVVVTGNTLPQGLLSVSSLNTSAAAVPIVVTGNQVTDHVIEVKDAQLRPTNLTGNTITGTVEPTLRYGGTLVENWTLPLTGPHLYFTDFAVAPGTTLTVPAGAAMEFAEEQGLTVKGSLVSQGTAAAPAVFAAFDGGGLSEIQPTWAGIAVAPGGSVSLEHTRLRGSITADQAARIDVTSSNLARVSSSGALGAVTITDNTIGRIDVTRPDGAAYAFPVIITGNTGLSWVEIRSQNTAAPPFIVTGNELTAYSDTITARFIDAQLRPSDLTGNTIVGGKAGFFAYGGTLVENWTLPDSGPQVVFDSLTIASGVTLTVPAGSVVKNLYQAGLTVRGSLVIQGTAASPVTFTSLFDDSVGREPLKHTGISPEQYPWKGIEVAAGGSVTGTNLVVKYATGGISGVG